MAKNKKGIRLTSLILILLIILAIIFATIKVLNKQDKQIINAKAGANTHLVIKDIKASAGQEINIEVNLQNDSNFVAANFEYIYDSTNLEYVDYKAGDSINNAAMLIVNNDVENSKLMIGFVANPQADKNIKSGNVISLRFKVKDNTDKNEIINEFKCTTLKDESGVDIEHDIKQGTIKIN